MRSIAFLALLAAVCFLSCTKSRIHDHGDDWGKYFKAYGIENGCIMVRDHAHDAIHYYNKDRCITRFTPASTFKIFNSLVALEVPIAPDDQYLIPWDSVVRPRAEWNKDLTMREAFKLSAVPYYQELARRIGRDYMQHYLDTAQYGNHRIGPAIDQFWLNDTLKISADEQLGMLKRMYFDELPFSDRSQRIVRSMMLQEENPKYKIYWKTGTAEQGDSTLYWLVGFAEKIEEVTEDKNSMNKSNIRTYPYFFAQNFTMPNSNKSHDWFRTRIELVHDILRDMEVLPPGGEK